VNRILLWAAVLAAFTAALHTIMGTAEITGPLLRSHLPPQLSLLLYACWHLVSGTLIASSAALFMAAREPERHRSMAQFVAWLWLCFGLVFIGVAVGGSGVAMLLELPQWSLLLPVGVFGLWGIRRK